MRLLAATDFALRTLMRLAAASDRLASTEVLAQEVGVPRNHLHKVVQALAEAGLVRTSRGAGGGVRLAHPPADIRLGEVVRWFEREQAVVDCFREDGGSCCLLPQCRLRGALARAQGAFLAELDRMTLAEAVVSPGQALA